MPPTTAIATELRDTVLQDLVAVSLMVQLARRDSDHLSPSDEVLERARQTLCADMARLRDVIDRLGGPAEGAVPLAV